MRKVQQRGLLLVVGVLGVVLLGLVGCGGTSGDGNSAGRTSRVVLQITTAEQAGVDALRQAGVPTALRAVPTDPNDPTFISRLVIEVTGASIPSPITQTVDLTAAQQEQVEVELQIPTGEEGRTLVNIIVDAFHTADGVDTKIFHGEALGVDLPTTAPVEILLEPVLPPDNIPDTTTTVHITFPRQVVPTDPNDLAFASSLAIEVTGAGIPSPILQTVTLTAAQQENVEVELQIPTGEDGRTTVNIIVDAFHTADGVDTKIFHGEALGIDLPRTEPVEILLEPVLLPDTPDTTTTVRITFPRQVVPTDPNDPAFVSRVDVQIEGEGIPTPVTQSVTLSAAQQTEVIVENLVVPTGSNRRMTVNAFHVNPSSTDEIRIFEGVTTADLLVATVTVPITLSRVPVPEAVTPLALTNRAFSFESTAAFGIAEAAILQFGAFTGNTGPFTLTSTGQTASGTITILPPASTNTVPRLSPTGTPRQGETSTSCNFTVETSDFSSSGEPQAGETLLMQPCETDALEGNLILRNAVTGLSSTSFPPVAASEIPPNTVRIGSPAGPVASGETFTVPVELHTGVTAIISYLFELTFNRDIVIVENITNGSAPFETPVTNPGAFTTGAVRFAANNTTFDPAARGLLRLATITFRVVGNSGSTSALALALPSDGALVDDITFASRPSASIVFLNGSMTVQ